MKRMLSWEMALLFAVSMFWVYASPAWAAEGSMTETGCPMVQAYATPDVSGLVGAIVKNQNNEELGRVVDATFSPDGGTNFLIVSSCLPGMTGQLVAVPYRSMGYFPQTRDTVTLNISTEDFKNAPSFSKDSWPNGVGKDWVNKDYEYFEKTQYFG